MRLRATSSILLATLALAGAYWTGCGDDDGGGEDGAVFFGNVESVTGGTAAISASRSFAARLFSIPSLAWAQSACTPPSGGDLLFCVDDECTRVDATDCDFRVTVPISGNGPSEATLRFVDDADEDGVADASEAESVVQQNLRFCDGDVIAINDAVINFTTGVTTAEVSKVEDTCPATTPTRSRTPATTTTPGTPGPTNTPGTPGPTNTPVSGTPGPAGTATRTRTPTPIATQAISTPIPTRTPTSIVPTSVPTGPSGYGTAMNQTPAPTLAFLASLGIIGLLAPRRRKRP